MQKGNDAFGGLGNGDTISWFKEDVEDDDASGFFFIIMLTRIAQEVWGEETGHTGPPLQPSFRPPAEDQGNPMA